MRNIVCTGWLVALLLAIPFQMFSQTQPQNLQKEVVDKSPTPDSLLLERPVLSLEEADKDSAGTQDGNAAKLRAASNATNSIVLPEVSYFGDYPAQEIVDKTNSSLRSGISSAVGEIGMNMDVAPNGSMVINVPIELTGGTGGMVPSLSLMYNNLSGNGVAGAGWHIAGIPSVTIRNKSIYYDGSVSPGNPNQHICWDGKRLIYNGGSGVLNYFLEGSSQTVTAVFNSSSSILEITDSRRHIKYVYGYNASIRSFRLLGVSDRHDNCISYEYTVTDNVYYLSRISYSGKLGYVLSKSVNFTYEDRPDKQPGYSPSGAKTTLSKRLKMISTDRRTYNLTYSNNYFSQLTRIGCAVKNGSKIQDLEPLYFTYGNNSGDGSLNRSSGTLSSYFTDGKAKTIHAVSRKLSSDSNEEGFAVYPNKASYQYGEFKGDGYKTLHSMYHPDDVVLIAPTFSESMDYFGTYTVKAKDGFRGVVTLNADNFSADNEVVLINSTGGWTNFTQNISFRVFSYAGLGYYGVTKTVNFTLPAHYMYNNYTSVTPISYQTGNFKGDGIERIAGIQRKNSEVNPHSAVHLFDLQNQKSYTYYTSFTINAEDQVITADYDGDGKTDLYHFWNGGFDIYSFVPANPASPTDMAFTLTQIAGSTAINRNHFNEESREQKGGIFSDFWYARRNVLFGDINGDGKLDIIKTAQYGTKDGVDRSMNGDVWVQVLSAGNGQFDVSSYEMPNTFLNAYHDVFMHDFNGDGCSDVVCLVKDKLQIIHSNGSRIDHNLKSQYSIGTSHEAKLFTIGVNYSNHNRIIGYVNGSNIQKMSIDRNELVSSYLTSALTSHNVRTNVSYARIDDPSSYCYSSGYGASFPYENYNDYYWVVSNVNKNFQGNQVCDLNYRYENAVVHRQGLGFCGFGSVFAYDYVSGKRTETFYDPLHFGIVKKVSTNEGFVENTYDLSFISYKEPDFKLTIQKTTDNKTGNVTTVNNSYDNYRRITNTITQYGSDLTKEVTIGYLDGEKGEFPVNVTTKTTRGSDVATQSVHTTYDDKLLPTWTINKVNGGIVSQTSRVFDSYSNVTKEEVIPYEATDKKTTDVYQYSSDGSKLLSTTNALGQTTVYDYSGDLISSVKDFKGNVVSYEYDAAGRVIKQTNPDNTVEQTSYAYDSFDYYTVTKTATHTPTTKVKYDGLHRVVQEEKQSLNSTVYRKTEYDYKGRVSRTSLPSFSTASMRWNTYSYDGYDRPTKVHYASGKQDSYSYHNNSVTLVIDGVSRTKTFNAAGELISVTDAAGVITYNLRADGNPYSIGAPGGAVTSFQYDSFGRRIRISLPSAGSQTYEYDAAGNMVKETDGRGLEIGYVYDSFGRLMEKHARELSTSYAYNADGLLTEELSGNGTSTSYTYDNLGRMLTKKDSGVDGKSLKKTYGYHQGRVSWLSYQTQDGDVATENYTYTNGYLSEIKLNGQTSIWKLKAENEFGQPTEVTTGSFDRTYGFDEYGFPTSRTAGSFMNYSFSFDPVTSNLQYRRDNLRNAQEGFTYDNLNRLVSGGGYSVSYDVKGNITKKGGAENSVFEQEIRQYGITGATFPPNSIPLRSQDVTYFSFKRPIYIAENKHYASFTYNGRGERVKMKLSKNSAKELNRYYLSDCYEIDDRANGGLKEKLYLGGDYYSAPAVYVKDGSSGWQLHYICRDYLGSITHVTNSGGAVVQALSYDAWGRLRSATHQAYAPDQEPELFLGRGYTGHEHLTMFGLINMNARLYDPGVGQFLSPDPFVQAPELSQNYNRYSYCLNNPLKYTDPNGEWVHIAAGAIIGGVANVIYMACIGQISSFNDGAVAFSIGATAGALGAATGGAAFAAAGGAAGGAGGFIAGAASGAAGSAVMMPVQSAGNHVFFDTPMMSWEDYAMGVGIGTLTGGVVNGTSAAINGKNFWTGNNVAFGRGTFSFSNTPTKPAPELKMMETQVTGVNAPAASSPKADISELHPTQGINRSKSAMMELADDINANGIKESIKYTEFEGGKYIVDGHHRYYSAQKLGISEIPVQKVDLPYGGYKQPMDLFDYLPPKPTWWIRYAPK